MRTIIAAFIAVLISTQAQAAECFPAHDVIGALVSLQYTPVLEMEIEHRPIQIFVNYHSQYIVIERLNSNTLCIIWQGESFSLYRERKA